MLVCVVASDKCPCHQVRMASGGIAFDQFEQPDMPQMTEAEMAAGVDVAHRRGIKVPLLSIANR